MADREPTEAEARSACLYFRHDFGLMDAEKQNKLIFEAREWLRAWMKVVEDNEAKK